MTTLEYKQCYWRKAKYDDTCVACEEPINEGDLFLFTRDDRGRGKVYCADCGADIEAPPES